MNIKIFGKLTDIFQTEEYLLNEKITTVSDLKQKLEVLFPSLQSLTYLVIVNNENTQDNDSISTNSEIALLPPYSGG
ncbi:MoaD/ThiS family protein [Apibacter raozihei]|uniref:MoaD/ThiS family protein n=1 Tax=Apibacter TaxID=1778601 RepID=UPI000FE3B047|nr:MULTISPECIES: MoaD/ThiS family protein [Apibacter]